MSTGPTNYLSKLMALDEDFQTTIVIGMIFVFVIVFIAYVIYLCDYNFNDLNLSSYL